MGKRSAVFFKSFPLLQSFLDKNSKIDFFKEKMALKVVFFYKIEV